MLRLKIALLTSPRSAFESKSPQLKKKLFQLCQDGGQQSRKFLSSQKVWELISVPPRNWPQPTGPRGVWRCMMHGRRHLMPFECPCVSPWSGLQVWGVRASISISSIQGKWPFTSRIWLTNCTQEGINAGYFSASLAKELKGTASIPCIFKGLGQILCKHEKLTLLKVTSSLEV